MISLVRSRLVQSTKVPRVTASLLAISVFGALQPPTGAASRPNPVSEISSLHPSQDEFDHAVHAGLFPTCTGCHQGAIASDRDMFPAGATCTSCHDGGGLEQVEWEGTIPAASNLSFDHMAHAATPLEDGELAPTCTTCHQSTPFTEVSRGLTETCSSCHAHGFNEHFLDAECEQCHTTLAGSSFGVVEMESLIRPADHRDPGFLARTHGNEKYEVNRCATCHTADRCAACHVEADLASIQVLGYARSGVKLPDFVAEYPLPTDHLVSTWVVEHGGALANASDCSTCHTRDDCTVCHSTSSDAQALVLSLPTRSSVKAPGLALERRPSADHSEAFFEDDHRIQASTVESTCNGCHLEAQCVACHEGVREPQYHPLGYEAGHAADAFGGFMSCSSCHSTAVFCRSCHIESGLANQEVGSTYHDAEPQWLLRHGQAARQTLDSCASCHQQQDCTRCHSAVGAFRVSPHGPDFDARSAWEKNFRACSACHIGDPIRP